MPRPQRELDPNGGALVAFARDLRALREQAGSPKFATMERRVGRSKSTLAEAVGGRHLPRWDTVADFVRACGADPAPWRPRWEQLRRELGIPGADSSPEPLEPAADEPADQPAIPSAPVESTGPEEPVDPASAARDSGARNSVAPDLVAPDTPSLTDEPAPGSVDTRVGAGTPTRPARDRAARRWSPATVGVAAASAAILMAAGFLIGRATGPEVAGPYVRAIEVQNKVALGAHDLVEDRTPVYLSSAPIAYCAARDRDCKVAGTEMGSGSGIVAHCVTHGQQMYNYNLRETAAESNPDRVASDRWYRATFPDGRSGFISEVYLSESSRGGLGLPDCGPGTPATLSVAGR